MSNTYFENGILKLRNVVVKLSNQGEIEIWDDEIYQLKFESVKLSNKDLNNIYNLVDKNWGGFIGSPKYYSYLSDYLEEKDDDDNDYETFLPFSRSLNSLRSSSSPSMAPSSTQRLTLLAAAAP